MTDCQQPRVFRAPWSRELAIMTAVAATIVGLPLVINLLRGYVVVSTILGGVFLLMIGNTILRYEVDQNELRVVRLFRTIRIPLGPKSTAVVQPGVMAKAWRTWGNGGAFSFSGYFRNVALGGFRAYVTDFKRAVVVCAQAGTVVVSPDRPTDFVSSIKAAAGRPAPPQ